MNLDQLPVRSRKLKNWIWPHGTFGGRAKIFFSLSYKNKNMRGELTSLKEEISELSNVFESLRLT